MKNVFLVPSWFLGYDILFELIFLIVTILISLYSFKIYNLTKESKPKLFGIGFLFISTGYLVQMIMNSIFFFFLKDLSFTPYQAYRVLMIYAISIYGYTSLMLLGIILIVYMTFNTKNMNILFLISILSLMILMIAIQKLLLFYVMSSIIAFFIALHFFKNYFNNKTKNSLLVLLGFTFIFIGYTVFVFSIDHHIYYFFGHFFKLLGYLFLLINLFSVVGSEKKFRKKINLKSPKRILSK